MSVPNLGAAHADLETAAEIIEPLEASVEKINAVQSKLDKTRIRILERLFRIVAELKLLDGLRRQEGVIEEATHYMRISPLTTGRISVTAKDDGGALLYRYNLLFEVLIKTIYDHIAHLEDLSQQTREGAERLEQVINKLHSVHPEPI